MQVTKQTIQAIGAGIKKAFKDAFNKKDTYYEKVAMVVPSSNRQETYAWLSKFPKMKEWIGDKVIHKMSTHGFSIVNKPFEGTIEVHKHDIADDNIGQYTVLSQQIGWSAAQLPDELIAELINKGEDNKCFDDKPFFSKSHPVEVNKKKTTVSNLHTLPKLSAASKADAKASYGALKQAMRDQKDEHGRNLKVKPDTLIVSTDLEETAKTLMNNEKLDNGDANNYRGDCEVVVIDDLDTGTWYLQDNSMPVKALVLQEREKPEMVSQTKLDSDDVFNRGTFKFGAEARYGAGYAFWQLMFKAKAA